MTYQLADGEARHAADPDTFEIPDADLRADVPIGHYVKLIFNDRERMWVSVIKRMQVDEKIVYHGKLNNDPVATDLKRGDRVVFEPRHIVGYMARPAGV